MTLIISCGFKSECNGGSHYTFEHESGYRFTVSKTHPSGVLKLYQIKDIKLALNEVESMEAERNEQ